MAGIYIHIPYCKQACNYCDFYFSVKQETKAALINSLQKEIEIQKDYAGGEAIETIYFGGGTPSILTESELSQIFESLYKRFQISGDAEITLEANPDDLTPQKLEQLRESPVNRLSIGVQSFFDKDLLWMNRAHNARQSVECINLSIEAGFDNLSIDLIYGLPEATDEEWTQNLESALGLKVQHISAYSLTVEPGTALAHLISKGKSKPLNNDGAARQFEILVQKMAEKQWLHYEISSFASSKNLISKHNSSYWNRKKYLGIGPSAHSFNGTSRQWNVSGIHQYIDSIIKGDVPFQREELTEVQSINEQIMTELRTMWGLKLSDFGDQISDTLKNKSRKFIDDGLAIMRDDALTLTNRGKLIADKIILELMIEEDEVLID